MQWTLNTGTSCIAVSTNCSRLGRLLAGALFILLSAIVLLMLFFLTPVHSTRVAFARLRGYAWRLLHSRRKPSAPSDPLAGVRVPLRHGPKGRSGAVALDEP